MTTSELAHSAATRPAIRSGYALAIAGAITPTLSIFAYKGLAPLFFIAAVIELGLFWRTHRRFPNPPIIAASLLAMFVLWGIAGAIWSLDGSASLATAGKLALMAALGLPLLSVARELGPPARQLTLRAARVGLVVGLILMAVEVFFGLPITHALYTALGLQHLIYPSMLNPAATVLVLIATITAGDLLHRKHAIWALAVGSTAVALAALSESMAAGVAGVFAAVVLAAVYWRGAVVARPLAVIAAVAIIAAPLLPNHVLADAKEFHWPSSAIPSVYQRIAIWEFTAKRIDERPILGWGLDAARRIPGGHEGIRAESLNIHDPVMREQVTKYFNAGNIEQMPLHPHNAALQIWLEAGAIGAVLTALLVLAAVLTLSRYWPVSRPGAAASVAFAMSALVIAGLSYGIWQTWWLATLWIGSMFAQLAIIAESKVRP